MGLRLTLDWGSAISPNLGLNLPQQIFCKIERKVKVQNYTKCEDECQHTANERRLTVQPIGIHPPPQTRGDISDKENYDDDVEEECQHTTKKTRLTVQPVGTLPKHWETYLTKKMIMIMWKKSANIPPRKDALQSSP